jgi:hypothetical protein
MTSAVITDPSVAYQNVSQIMRKGVRSTLNERGGLQTGEQNSWKATNLLLATSTAVTQGLYIHMIDL